MVNSEDDILKELSDREIATIRDMYKVNWPYGIYIYYFLDTSLIWRQKHGYKIRFYSPEGGSETGTIISMFDDSYLNIACYTLEKSNECLRKTLEQTKLIKWQKCPNLPMIHFDQSSCVLALPLKHSLRPRVVRAGGYWWLPKEHAEKYQIQLPAGTYLAPLEVRHTEQIYNVWPHRCDLPMTYIENFLEYNKGIGLFQTEDNSLSAWITRNEYSALAILQTEEAHRGKGYAGIVTKAICKQFAELGKDSFTFIVTGNMVSETLFKKLGFELVNFFNWMSLRDNTK